MTPKFVYPAAAAGFFGEAFGKTSNENIHLRADGVGSVAVQVQEAVGGPWVTYPEYTFTSPCARTISPPQGVLLRVAVLSGAGMNVALSTNVGYAGVPASASSNAGGGAVTIADGANATLGARADAPAASDTATASLMAFIKRLTGKIPGFGASASATSLPVVLASDDAQMGTAITGSVMPAGGVGLRGWLSAIFSTQAREVYTTVTILSQATNATGANFNTFPAQACSSLDVVNNTGVDIQYRRNAAGNTMTIPAGTSRLVQGITNANQVGVRRVDQQAGLVTIEAEAFAV